MYSFLTRAITVNADSGGDIVFKSSDSILFYVHSKNLEFMSEGFPLVRHTVPSKDTVQLTENSNTLELLFEFTHHRLPSDLSQELDVSCGGS
jgi:hypothetical protein